MRRLAGAVRVVLPALVMFVLAALPAAAQTFGPQVYTRSAAPGSDVFSDTFTPPAAGLYALWVHNGDDGGGRVAGGSIVLNGGATVATNADFAQDFFRKPVALIAGTNSISVTITGDAGSFITVGIVPFNTNAEANLGRLILPYASDPANLVLELKNGASRDRKVKVHFYNPAGDLVASSGLISVPARGSLSQTAQSLITSGAWTEGSIEVFWAGRGGGRLFGQAALKEASTQIASVVPLQVAGWVRRPLLLLP